MPEVSDTSKRRAGLPGLRSATLAAMTYRGPGVPISDLKLQPGSQIRTVNAFPIKSQLVAPEALGSLPSQDDLGEIVSADGYRYQITPEDILWLARSIQHEGGNKLATAWTYAQRMALFRRWGTLKELVQAHSQPVNPIWRRDGEKCRPGGPYHGRDECAERRLAVRDRAATMPWDEISPLTRMQVLAFAQARRNNVVPSATDFANGPVSTGFIRRHPGTQVVMRDGNWYLAEGPSSSPGGGSVSWPENFVTVRHRGNVTRRSVLAGIPSWVPILVGGSAAALAVGGLSVWALRRRRRSR